MVRRVSWFLLSFSVELLSDLFNQFPFAPIEAHIRDGNNQNALVAPTFALNIFRITAVIAGVNAQDRPLKMESCRPSTSRRTCD